MAKLYDALDKLNSRNTYPFHMPGHKRVLGFFAENPFSLDFTELDETDNLHNPNGIIKDFQSRLAEIFHAERSLFSVNGSSAVMAAAVMCAAKPGDKIIVARNCHISVYNGLVLSGAEPVYVEPELTVFNIIGGVSPQAIQAALDKYPDAVGAVITSPVYEGFTSDISSIAKILHDKGKILIVDEAHGAHFVFSEDFPMTAIDCGADISAVSLHKTLPVPTQCAVMNLKGSRVEKKRAEKCLSMLQTTSPSYVFMALADKSMDTLTENDCAIFSEYIGLLKQFRKNMSGLHGIRLLEKDMLHEGAVCDIDISRLTFDVGCENNAKTLENLFDKRYNLRIEMSGMHHLILISTVADTPQAFNTLEKALIEADSEYEYKEHIPAAMPKNAQLPLVTPREAFYRECISVSAEKAAGRISAEFIVPYPPGIPVIAPGEIITQEALEYIAELKNNGGKIVGAEDARAEFIRVFA